MSLKAQPVQPVDADGNPVDAIFDAVGEHTGNTDISGAVTLTKPAGATAILIQTITQNLRFRLDGVNPTVTVGFQLKAGDMPVLIPVPGASIRVLQETPTASLQYQWVR